MHADESTESVSPPTGLFGWSRPKVRKTALAVLFLLLTVRAGSEIAMMREYGNDAQMGIWVMYLIVVVALWFLGGAFVAWLITVAWPRRWALVGLVAFALWAAAIGYASWQYDEGRRALAEARNPQTSPVRLRHLVAFDGFQVGYELDNRLAVNPQTPPEVLRELASRVDQTGTQVMLEKNWRTPPDVLAKIRQAKR